MLLVRFLQPEFVIGFVHVVLVGCMSRLNDRGRGDSDLPIRPGLHKRGTWRIMMDTEIHVPRSNNLRLGGSAGQVTGKLNLALHSGTCGRRRPQRSISIFRSSGCRLRGLGRSALRSDGPLPGSIGAVSIRRHC